MILRTTENAKTNLRNEQKEKESEGWGNLLKYQVQHLNVIASVEYSTKLLLQIVRYYIDTVYTDEYNTAWRVPSHQSRAIRACLCMQ